MPSSTAVRGKECDVSNEDNCEMREAMRGLTLVSDVVVFGLDADDHTADMGEQAWCLMMEEEILTCSKRERENGR